MSISDKKDLIHLRYRFVGGPVNNELLTVNKNHNGVEIPERTNIPKNWDGESCDYDAKYISHRYLRFAFRTEYGTLYYQFIHNSLIVNGEPLPQTYVEAFPFL